LPIVTAPAGPHLFLLCGLPFSGKSTMSRALSERFGIPHVEVDRYVVGTFGQDRKPEPRDWLPAYRIAIDEIRSHLREGRSVVFDAVGHRRRHRHRMRRLASELGARMTIIYLDVGVEEARERLFANRRNPVRFDVPDGGFAWIVSEMEPPAADEEALIYRPEELLPDWIEREIGPLLLRSEHGVRS
jgi:predicted kinase